MIPRLQDVKQDSEHVAHTSADHPQVPDGMHVRNALEEIENRAGGVRKTARHKQPQSALRQRRRQRLHGKDAYPSHADEDKGREPPRAVHPENFGHNAGDGQHPHDTEQRPAHGAAERNEREGRIRSGDEQVDARVIEDLEDAFGPQ